MADVFFRGDAKELMKNKHIVFFGDSNVRAVYKDLIWLLNYNSLIDQLDLKKKQEPWFCGDKLGKHSLLDHGRDYEEERSYEKDGIKVDYYYITRCYNAMFVDMMEDIHLGLREAPDVIYINSSLWDVSRWGPNGVTQFKDNLQKLARLFKSSLPQSTMVIWVTAMPVSPSVKSGLLIKQIDFLQHTLRFDIMEANTFARQVMVAHGFDVLDLHFHLRMQIHRRVHDGVHYLPEAVRFVTNLLLTHIALNWDFKLPNRVNTRFLTKAKTSVGQCTNKVSKSLRSLELKSKIPNGIKNNLPARTKDKPKEQLSRRRENRLYHQNRNREVRHQSSRVKGVGRANNWKSAAADQRGWHGPVDNRTPVQNSLNFSPAWNVRSNIWSDDHWQNDQQFLVEESSRRFNESRFVEDRRFLDNVRQANMNLPRVAMRLRQSDMPFQSRYAPY